MTRGVKKPPFTPVRKLQDNKWFCSYGMHTFEWHTLAYNPVDCPDRHAFRVTLVNEMTADRELREYFDSLDTDINNLSKQQIVELIKRIKPPQESE